jgi:hypothetical protein
MGEIQVQEDHLNLRAGEVKKLNVTTAQEEGYQGEIAVTVEELPAGVTATPGTEVKPDQGSNPDEGNKERFVPKKEVVTILIMASPDAHVTPTPRLVRVIARPVIDGALGHQVVAKEIPMMVY